MEWLVIFKSQELELMINRNLDAWLPNGNLWQVSPSPFSQDQSPGYLSDMKLNICVTISALLRRGLAQTYVPSQLLAPEPRISHLTPSSALTPGHIPIPCNETPAFLTPSYSLSN